MDKWHELIGDPTLADAILDRLVHNAYHDIPNFSFLAINKDWGEQ